jgi:hypothetical protein
MFKYFLILEILVAVMAFVNGVVCFLNPKQAIRIQQKFYEKINWRLEPIDLNKELRNTRIMGMISLALSITLLIYIVPKP